MAKLLFLLAMLCVTAAAPAENPEKTPGLSDVSVEVAGEDVPVVPVEDTSVVPDVSVEVAGEDVPVVPVEDTSVVPVSGEATAVLNAEEDEETLKQQEEVLKMEEGVLGEEEEAAAPAPELELQVEAQQTDQDPQSLSFFCPDGWFRHGSRCFLFVNSPLPWHSAEDHCSNLGASLASVQNGQEYRFLQQLTKTAGQSNAWLGGFYVPTRWRWIDGTGFYYNNWYIQSTATSYPCIYLINNTGWRNSNCGTSLRFICATTPRGC